MSPTSFEQFEVFVGDLIRGGLATKGMDQQQAAKAMKLDVDLLRMIEDGEHFGHYPEHLINAIVRDYALFLGLDPLEIRSLYWREVVEKTLIDNSKLSRKENQIDEQSIAKIIKKFFASWA